MSAASQTRDFLYSQRTEGVLKNTVVRIQGRHDSFATDFVPLAGGLHTDGPIAERMEAWRNPDTGLWKIQRLSYLPGSAFRQETVAEDVCFFDALHYCARYQTAAADKGAPPVETPPRRSSLTHYREAAEAAGQAIDADGEVHPCAHGQVLTDGWFSAKAMADAEKTKSEELALALPAAPIIDSVMGGLLAPAQASALPVLAGEDVIARAVSRRTLISQFEAAISAGDKMVGNMSTIIASEFRTGFQGDQRVPLYFLTVITAGIVPAFCYRSGDPEFGVYRSFKVSRDKFLHAAKALPDCPEKSLLPEFAKAAEFTFWMERAAQVYQDCCDGERKPAERVKGLPYIEKAAAAVQLGAPDVNRIKDEYLAGRVECRKFWNNLQKGWSARTVSDPKALREKLFARMAPLKKNGGPA